MKILLSWLADYVDLSGLGDATSITSLDDGLVERVAEVLTDLGITVEETELLGVPVEGVITARVLRTEAHPDAAKVQRVWVDAGDGVERHIWCGASNMHVGDLVPLAMLGTVMPDGRKIERRGILGIDSEGMLCSAAELGLGDDQSGILILPAAGEPGSGYGEAVGLRGDVLFDLDLTRNRPDCWGYVGVARDLAAGLHTTFRHPPAPPVADGPTRSAPVTIVDGDRCGRFTSTILTGVVVGPSMAWMAARLEAAGMRPINNVVDVSNYVMLELNQPNHAYDLATLGGGGFIIRSAANGESITTLDGEERSLGGGDLLICDAEDVPIGIAGVMGGLDSEITNGTTSVALEMAWFEPNGVMATAARLGARTEASARNERGIDPYGIDHAINRFVALLRETCPDLVHHDGLDDQRGQCLPPMHRTAAVRVTEVNRILGTSLDAAAITELLDPIGFSSAQGSDGVLDISLPSWRPDSSDEIDVIEEVARLFGYRNLGLAVPAPPSYGRLSAVQRRRRALREVLLGLGISEAMPNPFLAPETSERALLAADCVRITNPLVAEESVLRTSLRPGLLAAVAFNASHRRPGVRLFEIGHVYPPAEGELPAEFEALGVVLAGHQAPDAVQVWREIAAALGIGARLDAEQVPPGLHPTRSATLVAGREPIGCVGELHPQVRAEFGLEERVAILELNLDLVLAMQARMATFRPISREPSSDLDLAFLTPDGISAERLEKALRQAAGALLAEISLFDVYRDDAIGPGRRSLAFRLRLQSMDRTLTDEDIAAVLGSCVAAAARLGAELRN